MSEGSKDWNLPHRNNRMATASARIFLVRHGDTDWITGGKLASRTEVPLSKQGETETELIRDRIIGENKLIDPLNVARM